MNEKNSELQKNAISNKYFLSSNMSKFWGVKRFIAMLAVCILLIACISMLGFNLSANNFVYAEEDTQTTSSDEDADEAALRGTAINSDWQFVDDVPVLQDVPQDANILYELHDMQGTIVQKSDIVDEQKYLVTATLTGDSAKSYYFAETGANSVSMFFENSTEISTLSVVADNQISALWALLILGLAIIGIAVAVVRIIVNIHENSQEKEEQKHNQKTCAFGGVALLAFLGLDVKVWMILAFVAVALFFIGVIIMLLTWRRHGHNMVAHVTTTPTNIYVTNSYNYLAAAAVEDEEEEVVEEKRRRNPSNFRVRLKASSDKCKDFYVQLKNFISGYRQIRFRMAGNIEKVMYQDQVLAFIGTTKRSLKLWLSLNPEYYDVEVYHHKDVSDKKRYEQVPMLVKVGSGRALARAEELFKTILAKHDVEQKIRHTDRDLQLLAYTLADLKIRYPFVRVRPLIDYEFDRPDV
jgi:hypothetical protein